MSRPAAAAKPLRPARLRLALAGVLAGLWAGAAAFGLEPDELFRRAPNLLAVARIADVQQTSQRTETFLGELNPGQRDLDPRNPLRRPIPVLAGRFLRNPALEELDPHGFMEVLYFNSTAGPDSPWVAAFRLAESSDYRRLLARQANVREDSTIEDVTTFKEDLVETVTLLYLTFAHGRIALFGEGLDAVKQARDLYLQLGLDGALSSRRDDLAVVIDNQRLTKVAGDAAALGLRHLVEDIVQDRNSTVEPQETPLGRGLERFFAGARGIWIQTLQTELTVNFTPGEIRLAAGTRLLPGNWLQTLLAAAPARKPGLAEALPAECVAYSETTIWPALDRQLLELLGETGAAAFGGVVSQDLRADLQEFLQRLEEAGPQAAAGGLTYVSRPGREELREPVLVKLIAWRREDSYPRLLTEMQRLLKSRNVTEVLDQQQIGLNLTVEPQAVRGAGATADRLQLALQMGGGDFKRNYLVANQGRLTALVVPALTDRPADEAQLMAVLAKVLANLKRGQGGLGQTLAYREHFINIGDTNAPIAVGNLNALGYAQLALDAAAERAGQGILSEALPGVELARQFREITPQPAPISWALGLDKANPRMVCQIPLQCAKDLAQACLGINYEK